MVMGDETRVLKVVGSNTSTIYWMTFLKINRRRKNLALGLFTLHFDGNQHAVG